jgi:uncharacterized protein YigE (DUF2233 family)
MNGKKVLEIILVFGLIFIGVSCRRSTEEKFVALVIDPSEANIEFFWKDNDERVLKSLKKLKNYVEKDGKVLRFAMNGGMYQEDNRPLGLFIQNQKVITKLNTKENLPGNFYLRPNGVFYLTVDRKAFLVTTQNFKEAENIKFATQSGPMLVIDGQINPEFKQGSENLNLRNGVCLLANHQVVFAISRIEVNFYDFAKHFQDLGCQNALYLDGFVSRMYLPEKNIEDLDGDFGVIIGITR